MATRGCRSARPTAKQTGAAGIRRRRPALPPGAEAEPTAAAAAGLSPRRAGSANVAYSPFFARNATRSRTRQEYPHSLSYQAMTFTQLPPITRVIGASTMEDRESPR